jgi:hypothetical protein
MRLALLALCTLAACAGCNADALIAPSHGVPVGTEVLAEFRRDSLTVQMMVTRVAPDSSWLRMYRQAAACAGLRVIHLEELRWFSMPKPAVFANGANWFGAYQSTGRAIFVVAGDTFSIRHEALHDLLWLDRQEKDHPRPPFGRCESVQTVGSPLD